MLLFTGPELKVGEYYIINAAEFTDENKHFYKININNETATITILENVVVAQEDLEKYQTLFDIEFGEYDSNKNN